MQSWYHSVVPEVLNIFFLFCVSSSTDALWLQGAIVAPDYTPWHTQLMGLFWASDWPDAETSTWQHIHNRQTSMPPAGFKPSNPARKRRPTYSFESAVTGISFWHIFQESVTHFYFVILSCILCTRHNCTWPIRFLSTLFLERLPYQRWI